MSLPPMNIAREGPQRVQPDARGPSSVEQSLFTQETLSSSEEQCRSILNSRTSTRDELIEALLLRGRTLQARGNFLLAVEDWKAVLRLDESNEAAQRLLSRNDTSITVGFPSPTMRTQPVIRNEAPPPVVAAPGTNRATDSLALKRIRVIRYDNETLLGYLDSSGQFGPVERAQFFRVPRQITEGSSFFFYTDKGVNNALSVNHTSEFSELTILECFNSYVSYPPHTPVRWHVTDNRILPERRIACREAYDSAFTWTDQNSIGVYLCSEISQFTSFHIGMTAYIALDE